MYALLAAFRGRSDNVQIYDVDLPTNSCGATVRAHGLRTGSDGFELYVADGELLLHRLEGSVFR